MNAFKLWISLFFITLLSCSPTQKLQKQLPLQIEKSPIFQQSFTGFALLDPENGAFIYEYQSDKYFTPASNTKIFTLYACLQILDDNPAVLRYEISGDSLIFWGTGNPTLLHPTLTVENPTLHFLMKTDKQLFFSSSNFEDERFGPGWAWDDFPYYFQPEKTALPLYGNVITFERDTLKKGFNFSPDFIAKTTRLDEKMGGKKPKITRLETENIFHYNEEALVGEYFLKEIPFRTSDSLFVKLMTPQLNKPLILLDNKRLPTANQQTIMGGDFFPVYKKMMQESDNFLAEQLLLMCADQQLGALNSNKIIAFAKDSIMQDLPHELLWRDGSGLSRYNMFTPRTIARLLEKIHQQLPEEKIFQLFPAGGEEGTIKDWYGGKNAPYIFAKTGTLTGKHCLSGYVKTRRGKTLIFSFMHNNYKGNSQPLKVEMQRILEGIYEQY